MPLLKDRVPEVRAAAVYALGSIIGIHGAQLNSPTQQSPSTPPNSRLSPRSPLPPRSPSASTSAHHKRSIPDGYGSIGIHSMNDDTRVDVRLAGCLRRLRPDGSTLVRHELLLALARLFFHPRHSLALQVVA
jgi:hypothetical protein